MQRSIESLIGIVQRTDSESILYRIADGFTWPPGRIFKKTDLSSTYRQCFYLLGLMISNSNVENQDLCEQTWEEIGTLLESIYSHYIRMFWPTTNEYKTLPPGWKQARTTSMPVFLDYFNTGVLAFDEQVVERFKRWFSPFDQNIYELTKLKANFWSGYKIYSWLNNLIYICVIAKKV